MFRRIFALILLCSLPVIVAEGMDGAFYWGRIPMTCHTEDRLAPGRPGGAFEYFFRYGSFGVPENVEVLGVTLVDGVLTLDVCEAILAYGGSAYERALAAQLVEIAREVPGAERFILKIEGEVRGLVKGTQFPRSLRRVP